MKLNKFIIPAVILILVVSFVYLYSKVSSLSHRIADTQSVLSGDGQTASNCTITTEDTVVIGDDISSSLLSNAPNRAWAKVSIAVNSQGFSTSSPRISLGSTATVLGGNRLSTSSPDLIFGLDTDLPYTGVVSGITVGAASTTVHVTECKF